MIDVNNLSRAELAYTSVACYLRLYPANQISAVNVEVKDQQYILKVFYYNRRSHNTYSHSYYFIKNYESEETQRFIDMLLDSFPGFFVTGDEIV